MWCYGIGNKQLRTRTNRESLGNFNANLRKKDTGLSEATVDVATYLGAVNWQDFVCRVNGNYGDTAPNGSGIHEHRCVRTQ
ncbi:hypothetical protein FQA39_LY00686 [Lamprigera yunnana]|nr:hypothetical protein FQA39_LY00686 [Lamprigera yunnana]